jgi:hypothetical protein
MPSLNLATTFQQLDNFYGGFGGYGLSDGKITDRNVRTAILSPSTFGTLTGLSNNYDITEITASLQQLQAVTQTSPRTTWTLPQVQQHSPKSSQ